ncbi:ubiquitin-conjugating enzyme [Apiospora arundinis]
MYTNTLASCLITISLATTLVSANTEKTIFLAPKSINIPSTHPNLDDLQVDTLTPENWAIRTYLKAQFPTDSAKYGKPAWLVLDQLTEGQRYEVRVCWAATQPTAFVINTYDLHSVFESAELITELSDYSLSRQKPEEADVDHEDDGIKAQILAAADYYTTNKTLMNEVPPVYVDIILDPYVFNLLPRSLLPTIGYVIAVAILSWFLGRYISSWIQSIAAEEPDYNKKEQ